MILNLSRPKGLNPYLRVLTHHQAYTIPLHGKLAITKTGFCYKSARLFNSLPLEMRKCQKTKVFKRETKKWVTDNIDVKP